MPCHEEQQPDMMKHLWTQILSEMIIRAYYENKLHSDKSIYTIGSLQTRRSQISLSAIG
jgi:hypothetical protein